MKDIHLAVVGVGALGSELCSLLAESAFTNVLVIDSDRLEQRNVELSFLYQRIFADRGNNAFRQFKSKLIVDAIHKQHILKWDELELEIADVGLGRLAACDLIISCTDNALARIETALAARVLGLPMLDGGVMGEGISSGRVSWFAPAREAACYLCNVTETRRAELLTYAASTSLGCSLPAEAPRMSGAPDTVREAAKTMLRLIREFAAGDSSLNTSFAQLLEAANTDSWTQKDLKLPRSVTCPWHDEPQGEWLPLAYDRPIRHALAERGLRIQLLWPQCIEALCRKCGHRNTPNRRVAFLRRKAVCPQCGALGSNEPIRVIDSLGINDPAIDFTPRQLGLPERHLYLFRRSFTPERTRKEVNEPVA